MSERAGALGRVVGTGVRIRLDAGMIDPDRFEREMAYAIKAEQHLWAVIASYKVSDRALDAMEFEPIVLDTENLLGHPLVGCLVCEEPYSQALRHRRCKGEPS